LGTLTFTNIPISIEKHEYSKKKRD